jgi:hypothetical protein
MIPSIGGGLHRRPKWVRRPLQSASIAYPLDSLIQMAGRSTELWLQGFHESEQLGSHKIVSETSQSRQAWSLLPNEECHR